MGISRQSGYARVHVDEATEHPAETALAAPAFAYVDFGVAHGLSRDRLMQESRLTDAMRADPDARCSTFAFVALWRILLTELRDVAVPIELAKSLDLTALGVIGQIVPRADSLQHGQQLIERFLRLTDTSLGSRRVERDDLVGYSIVHRPEVIAMRFPIELMIAVGWRLLSAAGGEPFAREVTFAHAAGYPVAAYEALFGVPVRFEQPESAVWIDRARMDEPFASRDPVARRYFEAYAERMLAALDAAPPPLVARVREAIAVELATSGAELARVAKRLAMSTRTLQRRLEETGTSYQDVVDAVRSGMARALLREKSRSIVDVAFELGYADLKSFYRAFRRWTETTPAEWRARNA
jgi:AraC-like DNA-binding protein